MGDRPCAPVDKVQGNVGNAPTATSDVTPVLGGGNGRYNNSMITFIFTNSCAFDSLSTLTTEHSFFFCHNRSQILSSLSSVQDCAKLEPDWVEHIHRNHP
eukprot:GFUD01039804.1.p1 GENE.GFUD01039804.1~~GFUD01039804.1.p1  ORF type:complete len:100 (+),score=10.54 GFUD01039804.1:174-473(+)